MTKERYAELVAAETGMSVIAVLSLLAALWPLIQKLPCFERRRAKLAKAIAGEFQECCKSKGRCPFRLRRTIEKHNQSPRHFWYCMNQVAFAYQGEVAAMMMEL